MKATEMIFLDNESLWQAIEKYANVSGARDYAIYKGLDGPAMDAVELEYNEARGVLRLMLGLPNESESKPALEEYGSRQDGELWTNWVRTYWLDSDETYVNDNGKTVYVSQGVAVQEAVASAMRLGSIRHKISHDYDIDENLNVVLIEWHTKEKK